MDDKQRMEFDNIVGFIYKNMGDEVSRKLRIGVDYFRDAEQRLIAAHKEKEELAAQLRAAQAELGRYKAGNASTAEIKSPLCQEKVPTGRCRKNGKCESWEPEPQTPGEGIVRETALERDEDKHDTERLPTVGEKKSFLSKLFGG
jgi:hypothetical protein